jgi:transcriptional regulator with XRE-family HTH domain
MLNPDELSRSFAEVIKVKRLESGLSHEQLAVKSGLDRSTISLYESGKRVPTLSSAQRIANALGLRLSKMISLAETDS